VAVMRKKILHNLLHNLTVASKFARFESVDNSMCDAREGVPNKNRWSRWTVNWPLCWITPSYGKCM